MVKFHVYDWDEYTKDDLIGSGSYVVPKDFHMRTSDDPITIKLALTVEAIAAAVAAAAPKVIRSTASQTKNGIVACFDLPKHFKPSQRKPDPKKKPANIPPMELTFVITEQRERSRLANKRVFFVVNAESAADEAETTAKDDARLLKNLFKGIPSDNGLSIGGIAQAEQLRRSAASEKERLGQMRMNMKKAGKKGDKFFTPHDSMVSAFLRASTILSSPQSRCVGTAMIALQDHVAIGTSRRKMIAWESKTAAERAEKAHKDRLMADPMEPTVEGEGIVVASHLRDIFVNRAWLDFGEKRGRDIQKRALKLLKEVDHLKINERVEDLDWVEAFARFEEIKVHPNDCFHEWWEEKSEKPRGLQQRSCEILQMFRSLRDEVSICVVGGKILRHLLLDACVNKNLVAGLKSPNSNFSRCCVVCADFDFTRDMHGSLIDMHFLFDGKLEKHANSTKSRIKQRRLLNTTKNDVEDSPGAEPSFIPALSLPLPTIPLVGDKKKKKKRGSASFQEPLSPGSEEEEIGMEEFCELLEDEPEIVIAVGAFFLEQSHDPEFQSGAKLLINPLNSPSVSEVQLESHLDGTSDGMCDKVNKKQAKLKLVAGLKGMGIVLNHSDVEELFGRFALKMSDADQSQYTIKEGEDPNEVLLEVAKHMVEEIKLKALLLEQQAGLKRKNTMKEKLHRSTQLFNVSHKFPNIGLNDLTSVFNDFEQEESKQGSNMSGRGLKGSWASGLHGNNRSSKEAEMQAVRYEEEKRGLVGLSDSPERPSQIDRSDSIEIEVDENGVEIEEISLTSALPSKGRLDFEAILEGEGEGANNFKNQAFDELKEDESDEEEVVEVRNSESKALALDFI